MSTARFWMLNAGVGALTFRFARSGHRPSRHRRASAGYAGAASDEAARRRHTTHIDLVRGDFLEVADTIPMAERRHAPDRVICCYPLYEQLLSEALRHAERGFAVFLSEIAGT